MTRPWDSLATHRKKKRQTFDIHLTKGVSVNPKAYCCDDPEGVTAAKPPVAILTATPNPVQAGNNVTLDLSQSYDPNGGAIAAFHIWDGQGNNQAGVNWVQGYANPGRFEAMGVVTDATGLKGQASVWVDVLAGPDPPVPDLTGKKVIIATLAQGVIITDDIYAAPTVWALLNGALGGNALIVNGLVRDPWDSSDRALIFTDAGIYLNTDIPNRANWTQVLSNLEIDGLTGDTPCLVQDLKGSICQEGLFFAIVGQNGGNARYVLRSENGGAAGSWALMRAIVGTCAFWAGSWGIFRANYAGVEKKQGNLYLSHHDAQKLWVFGCTCYVAVNARSTILYSDDQFATAGVVVKDGTSGLNRTASGHIPYYDNADDQRMFVWNWEALGGEYRSPDGGTNLVAIAPPTNVRFKGMLGEHTWNPDLIRCVGEIGAGDSNGELTVSTDKCVSWSTGVDIGMPVWSMSGFPYDQQLMFFGRAKDPALGNYPADGATPLIKTTSDGGGTLDDRSGNLRADFNVKAITAIVPDWLGDE